MLINPGFLQGRISDNRAPGKKSPKCPDCGHDIRVNHQTPVFSNIRHSQYRAGWCNKCRALCPTLRNMFARHTHLNRKNFYKEMKNILNEEGFKKEETSEEDEAK